MRMGMKKGDVCLRNGTFFVLYFNEKNVTIIEYDRLAIVSLQRQAG